MSSNLTEERILNAGEIPELGVRPTGTYFALELLGFQRGKKCMRVNFNGAIHHWLL